MGGAGGAGQRVATSTLTPASCHEVSHRLAIRPSGKMHIYLGAQDDPGE